MAPANALVLLIDEMYLPSQHANGLAFFPKPRQKGTRSDY
jgi:hypothetical protein